MMKIVEIMTNFEKNNPSFRIWLILTVHSEIINSTNTTKIAIDVTILYTSETLIQSKSSAFSQWIPFAT